MDMADPSKLEGHKTSQSGTTRRGNSRERNAMGEYIPATGGRPLSVQSYPTPSPMDYNLQGVSAGSSWPNAPMYSLRTRLYPLAAITTPSPSDYNTSHNSVWGKAHGTTLKAKHSTWPYSTRKDAHVTVGPGAGNYCCKTGDMGSGLKVPLSARHREGINAGYPNPLVQSVDTHGFAAPGPLQFSPDSERGVKHVIAKKLKGMDCETLGPGPAGYSLPSPASHPSTIGEKLSYFPQLDYPSPNTYSLPQPSPKGKTFGLQSTTMTVDGTPPPNTYCLRQPHPTSAACFTLRPIPRELNKCEPHPSPAQYSTMTSDISAAPQYSCRPQCVPVFPDVLNYPEYDVLKSRPGPETYNQVRDFSSNSNPTYSIGLPLPAKPNTNPAPNRYAVNYSNLSTLVTPPKYTLRPKTNVDSKIPGPGPAAYNPSPSSHQGVSITPRRENIKNSSGPSPNDYILENGTTRSGVHRQGRSATMKSRHTSLQYSGFPTSALTRLQSLS